MKKIMYFLLIILSVSLVACEDKKVKETKLTYKATQKLPEVSSADKDGLYIYGFNTDCTSHVYDEATQTGTLNFAMEPLSMFEVFSGCKDLISVNLPSTIFQIGSNTFKDSGLKEFTFPDGVNAVGIHAFANTQIESIIFPSTVTSIGTAAFQDCKRLTEVYFFNGIDKLSDHIFENCTALKTVFLPASLSRMSYNTFKGCTSLATVTCMASVPPTISPYVFEGIPSDVKLYVPKTSLNAYKTNSNWTKSFRVENILPLE